MAFTAGTPSKDTVVRRVAETTLGVTPAGAMIITPFGKFNFTGGAPSRSVAMNVAANQLPQANIPETTSYSGSGDSDSLYDHYLTEEANLMAAVAYSSPITVTGTDISAATSGNKLVKAAGTWGGLARGMAVEVSGTGFGTYVAKISGTVTATDLPLDAAWKTISIDIASGASVTVKNLGYIRPGTGVVPTNTYEMWNTTGSHGQIITGAAPNEWTWGFAIPKPPTNAFKFIALTNTHVGARLVNTSTAAAAQYPHNSNLSFGYGLTPSYGGGFRYGGVLLPDLRISKFTMKLTRPAKTGDAAGYFGPKSLYSDGLYVLTVDMDIYRDTAGAQTILTDTGNIATVASIAFVMVDPNGKKKLFEFQALEPIKGDGDGLKDTGEEMASISFLGKDDGLINMLQLTLLG
jgi:hypothetical protein